MEAEEEQYILENTYTDPHKEFVRKATFHRENVLTIKRRLGNRCSYLSWARYRDTYGMKAVLDGTKVDIAVGGTPDDVTSEGYEGLFEQLDAYGKDN